MNTTAAPIRKGCAYTCGALGNCGTLRRICCIVVPTLLIGVGVETKPATALLLLPLSTVDADTSDTLRGLSGGLAPWAVAAPLLCQDQASQVPAA